MRWRSAFIEIVHRSGCDIWTKALLLVKSLSEVVLMKLDVPLAYDYQGYRCLIAGLEQEYGGRDRIINQALSDVRALTPIKSGNIPDLEKFVTVIRTYMQCLREGDGEDIAEGRSFYMDVIFLLPFSYKSEFKDWTSARDLPQTTRHVLQWATAKLRKLQEIAIESRQNKVSLKDTEGPKTLEKRMRNLNFVATEVDTESLEPEIAREPEISPEALFVSVQKKQRGRRCIFCRSVQHNAVACKEFQALSARARRGLVGSLNLCYICGDDDHHQNKCQAENCKECGGRHHVNLHEGASQVQNFTGITMAGPKIALTIAPVLLRNPATNTFTWVNALLDTGNTAPFLSRRAAAALDLTGYIKDISVQGVGGQLANYDAALISRVDVLNDVGKKLETITVRVIENPAGNLQAVNWTF